MTDFGKYLYVEHNTVKARAFREAVTAGWNNLSDGNVEAPTGHFAIISIEESELKEFNEVFEEQVGDYTFVTGFYLLTEDSDGNSRLREYQTLDDSLKVFNELQVEFSAWSDEEDADEIVPVGNPWDSPVAVLANRPKAVSTFEEPVEKLYLACGSCGEAFDDIIIAQAHVDNSTGHDETVWTILPESEAM